MKAYSVANTNQGFVYNTGCGDLPEAMVFIWGDIRAGTKQTS